MSRWSPASCRRVRLRSGCSAGRRCRRCRGCSSCWTRWSSCSTAEGSPSCTAAPTQVTLANIVREFGNRKMGSKYVNHVCICNNNKLKNFIGIFQAVVLGKCTKYGLRLFFLALADALLWWMVVVVRVRPLSQCMILPKRRQPSVLSAAGTTSARTTAGAGKTRPSSSSTSGWCRSGSPGL